jgi:RimJ/RimL family protein N-acetyltransferase
MATPFALEGTHVRLEPLSTDHEDGLLAAATGDRSTFAYTLVPGDRASVSHYIERALGHAAAGDQVPFAVVSLALDRVVGSTRFYELEPWDWASLAPGAVPAPAAGPVGRVEGVDRLDRASIGHTWLDPAVQRTPVNTEMKLLMLDHAFATWGVRAVRLQTDARNARSRIAIARLGCSLDGVLRVDRPASDGTVRDSAVFSMLAEEWPSARQRLVQRLDG